MLCRFMFHGPVQALMHGVKRQQLALSPTLIRASLSCNVVHHFSSTPVCYSAIPEKATYDNVKRWKIKALKKNSPSGVDGLVGQVVKICGWVRTIREQKLTTFIEVNDGSTLSGMQSVLDIDNADIDAATRKSLSTGAAVEIIGKIVLSPGKEQSVELAVMNVKIIGECSSDTYPLQKKRHSLEFLRSIAHLRPRTNTLGAVARIRSVLAHEAHCYFQNEGFLYVQTPIITASDCEGAGEMFRVTTLPMIQPGTLPVIKEENSSALSTDFSQDFFRKSAFLTVSGQLSAEAYACAVGDVYTFGPTFRAEKSQTTRHLAEFNMLEPELAFANLHDAMDNAESFLKSVVDKCRERCSDDLKFFESFYDKTLTTRLDSLVQKPFARISYIEAVELIRIEIKKNPKKWKYPDMHFGVDLQTEHERWLSEVHFKGCVFVHDYPSKIKSFYMRNNEGGDTVASFDLLVPGVGELMGGAQREERYDVLVQKIQDFNLSVSDYEWYLDLRRFGSIPHAGYGVGFERLVCYVTGLENIKDAIAFPRYIDHAEF